MKDILFRLYWLYSYWFYRQIKISNLIDSNIVKILLSFFQEKLEQKEEKMRGIDGKKMRVWRERERRLITTLDISVLPGEIGASITIEGESHERGNLSE